MPGKARPRDGCRNARPDTQRSALALFGLTPAVITAGVVAAAGDLTLAAIIPAAAAGAFLGDNLAYLIGQRFRRPRKESGSSQIPISCGGAFGPLS
jgi:hypothetical protein